MNLLDFATNVGLVSDSRAVTQALMESPIVDPLETKGNDGRTLEIPMSPQTSDFIRYGYTDAYSAASAMALYDKSSFVSIPVNKISKPFSCINPVLENISEQVIVRDHEVLNLLRNPAAGFTQELFLKTLANHYLITGEAHIIANGGVNRPPLELSVVSPKDVSIVEGMDGLPVQYQVAGLYYQGVYKSEIQGREQRFFDGKFREMKMIRDFSTDRGSRIRGQSVLKSGSRDIKQAILGTEHNVSMLEKGGRISLVFHFSEDFDDEDYEIARSRVMAQYGGATAAGAIGVTSGGNLDIKEAGVSNRDMDYANLHEMIKQTLALLWDVPLPLVSLDASTMNNYGIAVIALYDDAILPLAKVLFGGLGEILLPRYGMDPTKWRITVDLQQITALVERTLNEIKLRKDINVESDNELRAIIGREPYSGGNKMLKPSNLIPMGNDLFDDTGELFDLDAGEGEDPDSMMDPELEMEEDVGNGDGVNKSGDSLNGAQINAMVDLVAKVGSGELPKETAAAIMVKAFGFDLEEANRIIGDPKPVVQDSKSEPVVVDDEKELEDEPS